MLSRIIKISGLFIFSLYYSVSAQQLALRTYTVEDGLVQSSVYSMFQDKDGYMWIGTEGGISKFDGINFINLTTKDGLPDNYIRCMIQDKSGDIWFGTFAGGISRYDGKNFTTYDTSNGLCNNQVYTICEDKNGNIWVGTDQGASRYDGKNFVTYSQKNGLKKEFVRIIYKDSKGNLWFGYGGPGGGITRYDGKNFSNFSYNEGIPCDKVLTIFEDKSGTIWLGTYEGIVKFDGNKFIDFSKIKSIPKAMVSSIVQDKNGVLWFGTYENGLIKYENEKVYIYGSENGLSSNSVQTMYEGKRGDLWIGMYNGGIARYSAERYSFYTSKDGLLNESIYAVNEYPKGVLWIGTYGGGLVKIENNKLITYTSKNGLPDDFISSMMTSRNNSLWIGTMHGISNYVNGHFRNYSTVDGLADNLVFCVHEDESGIIWIATNNGISRFDGRTFNNLTEKDGLINNIVYTILEDSFGNLWFGTADGLSKYDGKNFTNFNITNGLINNTVFSLCEDNLGYIWVGTTGGVSIYNGTQFSNFNNETGLSDNNCNFLLMDKGYLYIGTNKGINKLDLNSYRKGNFNIKVYTAKDGLPSSECTTGGGFKDSNGILWFGTIKGVIQYNPKNVPKYFAPPIFISQMKVMDKSVPFLKKFDLKYFQNYIRFEYHSLIFGSPEDVEYKYKLDGSDQEWHLTNDRSITYSSLKPGEYKFRVIAKNKDGIWSTKEASVSFIIHPPFYETAWFRISMIIIALLSTYSIYLVKTRQVKRRNLELAMMVKERTKELEQEKNKSEELLQNILPVTLVEELKTKGHVKPREFKNVSILFTDFKGFTYIAAVLPADKLVNELNEIFKHFDKIIEKYQLEKLKTIGDSYMVGAGLPNESDDHAVKIILAGLEMQKYICKRNELSAIKWEMRAGIHSGHVIAGVVGSKKFTYDIWGDTVNIASRMESAGASGEINISAYTYMLVKEYFDCEYRGKVSAKGKGELDMYFVKGIKEAKLEEISYNVSS